MREYISPLVIENDMLAEAIYAASGVDIPGEGPTPTPEKNYDRDPECWTITPERTQVVAHEGYAIFRVQCNHSDQVVHHSDMTEVVLSFNKEIVKAEYEGNEVQVNGCTVVGFRRLLGDSYGSGDNFNSMFRVWTNEGAEDLRCTGAQIFCKHGVNVQGGFD